MENVTSFVVIAGKVTIEIQQIYADQIVVYVQMQKPNLKT